MKFGLINRPTLNLVLALLLVAVVGGGLGYFVSGPNTKEGLQFSPAQIDLSGNFYVSGEIIELQTLIRNNSAKPIELTDIQRSCSCVAIDTHGHEFKFPVLLRSGEELPIRARVYSADRLGKQEFFLTAKSRREGGSELPDVNLLTKAQINSSVVPIPSTFIEFVKKSETISRTLVLADDWPGEGTSIMEISSTSPDRFQFKKCEISGTVNLRGLAMKKRFEVDVKYTPAMDASEFSEKILIHFSDHRVQDIQIPFNGKVQGPYEFLPSSLTLYGVPGAPFRR